MQVSIVVGNPNPGGRTTRVARAVGDFAIEAIGAGSQAKIEIIELAHVASHLFEWKNDELAALNEQVASSDLVIAACPVYKASYTGLLKAFLDRYQTKGMAGTISLPVMVGAAAYHALAVENHLRPLLVELGSSVPTKGLYVMESQLDELDIVIDDFMQTEGKLLRRALAI
jgi:FMN reductase|tara:strand:+ start:159 stop:671 length:513 start_codon:yes stop_codon:yes gene_type:complete